MKLSGSLYRFALACAAATLTLLHAQTATAAELIDNLIQRFQQSDFEFVRAQSNAPFVPLAWLDADRYQRGEFNRADGAATSDVTFEQTSVSQGALVPIVLGKRDALVVGEWLSWTHFDLQHSPVDELEVFSAAVPIGWVRQVSPQWQAAAFVAPLGHKTHGEDWYWETLGGIFARKISSDRFAWIVGFYFDVAPLEDFYTPYLGAAYVINDQWTLNAVMPWPSVTYAPTPNTFFMLGVSPSGASWSIEPGEQRPRMSLSAWNLGLSAEHRIYENLWLGAEAGVSGLRGLSLQGNDWQDAEAKLDHTGYVEVRLNWRVNP